MKPIRKTILATSLAVLVYQTSCSTGPSEGQSFQFDFTRDPAGWTAGFADYPVGQKELFELEADYRPLQAPLDTSKRAHYISGSNRSDDLFMYYKGQIRGLSPGTRYRAQFAVEIATNVPSGCSGIGGAPGESVSVKAGASEIEPEAVVDGGFFRMNIDKGQQSNGGANAVVLGDVANSTGCEEGIIVWELKELPAVPESLLVAADAAGSVWVFAGTDSGFEGKTSLYYTRFAVSFFEE